MPPDFEPFPSGLLLGALALIFAAQLFGAWLTRDRASWSLLVLTGAAGFLHPSFVEACMPASLGSAFAVPPDPRLHGWLAMLAGHACLYLGGFAPQPDDTISDRVRRFRLPVVLVFGIVLMLVSRQIESPLLGSVVLGFHAGLVFAVAYATAMQRRFAEGMRPAAYLIAALLVLAVGTPLIVWVSRRSHLTFDTGLLAAGVLILHLLLLGMATLAEPFERLRHRLRQLEAEQDAAAAAQAEAAALRDENRRVEDKFLARAAEIAALAQELDTTRQQLDATRRRLSALAEEGPDALITIDGKSQQILAANARAEELFGISRDELRGWPLARLFPAEQSDQLLRRLLEAPSGEAMGDPIALERKGGLVAAVDVTPVVVHSKDLHIVHFFLRDRTRLDQQATESRHLRARLDALLELPDVVIVAAAPEMGIVFWNATAASVAGLPAAAAKAAGPLAAREKLAGPAAAAAIMRLTEAAAAGRRPFPESQPLADGRFWQLSASRLRASSGDGWLLIASPLP